MMTNEDDQLKWGGQPGLDMLGKHRQRQARIAKLNDGDKDWQTPCVVCDQLPTVHPTELCGPCCFGEADTAGGNW